MKIEVLFPEFCNLYGDMANIKYIKECIKDIEIIETPLTAKTLAFIEQDVDLVYMGPMTEKTQEKVIKKLMPYKEKIINLIEDGKLFLFTGNAFEIMGQYIENEDGSKIEGLGIFNIYSKRKMLDRYAGMILGEFNDLKIIGFKNQFSHSYGDNSDKYFVKAIKGIGLNEETKLEGIHYKNFFGTYILGPMFILNPLLVKYIFEVMGLNKVELAFNDEIMAVYNKRLEEFERLEF